MIVGSASVGPRCALRSSAAAACVTDGAWMNPLSCGAACSGPGSPGGGASIGMTSEGSMGPMGGDPDRPVAAPRGCSGALPPTFFPQARPAAGGPPHAKQIFLQKTLSHKVIRVSEYLHRSHCAANVLTARTPRTGCGWQESAF